MNLYSIRPHLVLTALFGLCVLFYVLTIPLPRVDGMLIGSDGVGYYMYVRSLVIDHDLDFANEYARLYSNDLETVKTPTGLTANQFAIGPGILWIPFFLVAHLTSWLLESLGVRVGLDGYGQIYQAAICLGSIVYGFFGILLMYQVCRRFYPQTALAAALLIWLATNVIYYMLVEPSMSHMCSLFAVALMVWLWIERRPLAHWRGWFLVGLAGGLVGIVRQPDAALVILPLLDGILEKSAPRFKVQGVIALAVGFLLVFSVQMSAWQILNGSPFVSGYLLDPTQRFAWLSPHFIDVFLSTEHGLFSWHPVLLAAALGFLWLRKQDLRLTLLLVFGIVLQAYIISAWTFWSQADSFGGRMFIASLPLFALGLSSALDWVTKQKWQVAGWLGGAGAVAWNAIFLVQYRLGYISMSGPYTLEQLTLGKALMLADLVQKTASILAR